MYHFIGPHHQFTLSKHGLMLIVLLVIWEGIWKGIALWKAGKNKQLGWFVVMLIVNTAGLLEIIYIFFFQNKQGNKSKS